LITAILTLVNRYARAAVTITFLYTDIVGNEQQTPPSARENTKRLINADLEKAEIFDPYNRAGIPDSMLAAGAESSASLIKPHFGNIVSQVTSTYLLGEEQGCLPYSFPGHIAEIVAEKGQLATICTTGVGFSEDVDKVDLVRVTGAVLFQCLAERGVPEFEENYYVHWPKMLRKFLRNPELRPFKNKDRAAVVNAFYEEGQRFPVHVDLTAGSMVINLNSVRPNG
jgi:hypothetical protein